MAASSSSAPAHAPTTDDLAEFEEFSPFVIGSGMSRHCNTNRPPIVDIKAAIAGPLRASDFPPIPAVWASIPGWIQDPLKAVFNSFKGSAAEVLSLRDQLSKLEAHQASGTYPQFVLTALPGLKSLAVDTSVIRESEHNQLIAEIASSVDLARSTMLKAAIEAKRLALMRHSDRASLSMAIESLREQFFENLRAMEISADSWSSQHAAMLSSAVCHLVHMISEYDTKCRWTKVKTARTKAKSMATTSSADVVMEDSSSIHKSVEKLVATEVAKLGKQLRGLAVQQGKGHRPRVQGSALGRCNSMQTL
ncbi:hypothetical protein BX666DRAFT_1882610 [Dichotomocladium elegans]|nr:hypothetical protein BX666DRAFT_1882610 [Dichotomocladium elegans]